MKRRRPEEKVDLPVSAAEGDEPWISRYASEVVLTIVAAIALVGGTWLLPAIVLALCISVARTWTSRRAADATLVLAIVVAGLVVWTRGDLLRRDAASLGDEVVRGYEDTMRDMRRQIEATALDLIVPGADRLQVLESFRRLQDLLELSPGPATDLVLVDPDGRAVSWAGEGLNHALPEIALPAGGGATISSHTSVTFLVVEPLDIDSRRPWRLVGGMSLPRDRLPFVKGNVWIGWSVDDEASVSAAGADFGWPTLELDADGRERDPGRRRLATTVIAMGLLAFGVVRALEQRSLRPRSLAASTAYPVSLAILVLGYSGTWVASACALAGWWLLVLCLGAWERVSSGAAASVLSVALPSAAALTLGLFGFSIDLGDALPVDGETWLWRLCAWFCGACGLALGAGVGATKVSLRQSETTAAVGLLLCGLACAVLDTTWMSVALLAVSSLVVTSSLKRAREGTGRLLRVALFGMLIGFASWTTMARALVQSELESLTAEDGLLLSGAANADLLQRVEESLERDLRSRLKVKAPVDVDSDLALLLWSRSELATIAGPSAVSVVDGANVISTFSYGLPLDRSTGYLDTDSRQWAGGIYDEWWDRALVSSVITFSDSNLEIWYWTLPLARLATEPEPVAPISSLTRQLLRSTRVQEAPLVADATLTMYSSDGHARLHAGREPPTWLAAGSPDRLGDPLPERVWTRVDDGWVRAVFVPALDAQVIVFLPRLGWAQGALEVGLPAVSTLLGLAATLLLSALVAALRREVRRGFGTEMRRYSRRLVAVFGLLVLLPTGLLNGFLFQSFSERLLSEQRSEGESALLSAERLLSDYLPTLEPGFSISSYLDEAVVGWLPQVIRHEVNIYWRGEVEATSRPELFTTGLLTPRIPGDVFASIELAGERIVPRVKSGADGISYLELYKAFELPGISTGSTGLFLSVSLLAQQEEAARETRELAQQALVVTVFLLLALALAGTRLAQTLTMPLTNIARGTERIAAGARTLGIQSKTPELRTLVEAMDDMAARIADGREQLLQEKQLVDGVLTHITSAVVSVGRDGRIQLLNEHARELLGGTVGQPVRELFDRAPLEGVGELLDSPVLAQGTLRTPLRSSTDAEGASADSAPEARQQPVVSEVEREWSVLWAPVAGDGDPAALLVVEDVTEVLRSQRLEAWAEMARMIAHEIKNPLTPIRLSAEHLKRVRSEAPEDLDLVFDRCIDNILEQVVELRRTAGEFASYSRIPSASMRTENIVAVVREVLHGYSISPPPGVELRLTSSQPTISVQIDRHLIARALRNLLENAVYACSRSPTGGTVEVTIATDREGVSIAVADDGPGVDDDDMPRLFEPSFSTSSGGTGLGLAITRRIIDEHGGSIRARNRPRGFEMTVRLPFEHPPAPSNPSFLESPDT